MELEFQALDSADSTTVLAALDILNAATAADMPDLPPRCRYAFQARFAHPTSYQHDEGYLALAGGAAVGVLVMGLPQQENTEGVLVNLTVHPDHRGRGFGRALYDQLVRRTRELGRKRLFAFTPKAVTGEPERISAGGAFAASLGAKDALEDVRRTLDLATVDEAKLDKMLVEAWSRADGYQLVTWTGATPEQYLADAAYLEGRLSTDAPMGELTVEPEQIDASRLRESDEATERARYHTYSAGAVHQQSGRLVALTCIGRQETVPEHGSQWITLVDPDHRGHRLGTVVKVENLRQAVRGEPQLKTVHTWNAASNSYMIAINEEMGFRVAESWSNWELEL